MEFEHRNAVAIEHAKITRNHAELRSFSGLCNVYREFVEAFAKIAALLHQKKGKMNPI